ncbi:D-2-hydroxyacid dehydrogenase family protein [Pseudorhizobium pelagicum]|uniref:2-hydroxyacid dehydrogenase n=1 Tax=Pseudorhizobium pelagicum TaxID=1509405 RepID=A0A922NYR1_9HYPH|nr:D-2-hydroxyacid dehydrogenase family protein [Pseudorhizobium pelagicum]KEQ08306.1 2-hydroxyacid dehydrogenase [Pseudorhizobium pelagicum]KEQ09148.1 2-hydroxyacid dehydrogenase [Pseudorhizobium pelagicum]
MNVAILDDYLHLSQEVADWSPVAARASVTVIDRHFPTIDAAAEALADYEILCTLRERLAFPRELIERLPRLRYLCVTGKRYDTVDIDAAREQGVVVSNTPVTGAGAGAVVELTWGLILALARNIAAEDRMMRSGGWQHFAGTTLRGKTLGVVGLGGLGTGVAAIGKAFGMRVIAWSPNLTRERAEAAGVELAEKQELFRLSDVVTLHLALAEATWQSVGAVELEAMKPTAFLVNTARAGLVDDESLLRALKTKKIAGAGLDVYAVEPLAADHELRTLDNVVLTPHLGYFTREMLGAYYSYAIENILSFLDGAPLRVVSAHD